MAAAALLGSVLFTVSALAAYTRPVTGNPVNIDIADRGTLTGALCFSLGGVLPFFGRPWSSAGLNAPRGPSDTRCGRTAPRRDGPRLRGRSCGVEQRMTWRRLSRNVGTGGSAV